MLTRKSNVTPAVAMEQFGADQSAAGLPLDGQLMAAGAVSALPVVVLYLLLQRHLVDGLGTGSVRVCDAQRISTKAPVRDVLGAARARERATTVTPPRSHTRPGVLVQQ